MIVMKGLECTEHIDVSNLSLAILGAEIFRFVSRTTDLKDPVCCFKLNIIPNSKFQSNGMKNTQGVTQTSDFMGCKDYHIL